MHPTHIAQYVAEAEVRGWCRWVCTRCGVCAKVRLRELARPCREPTATGTKVLAQLAAGKPHPHWRTEQRKLQRVSEDEEEDEVAPLGPCA